MIKFRQQIKAGDKGADVVAVRIAMRQMGHTKLAKHGRVAGPEWVATLKEIQKHHLLAPDGVYGPKAHNIIAPHMTAYARWLYRHARLRKPPLPFFNAQAAAQKLLAYHAQGKYRDDSGRDLYQIQLTAQGKPVYGSLGYVHLDKRILDALVWLIEQGHTVGTFAICSDHQYDGPHGHAAGHAVDVSSFDGVSIASPFARNRTLELAKLLHNAPALLRPWQLICGGYGNVRDTVISAETIPSAAFYGSLTMSQHCNHIHLGYWL